MLCQQDKPERCCAHPTLKPSRGSRAGGWREDHGLAAERSAINQLRGFIPTSKRRHQAGGWDGFNLDQLDFHHLGSNATRLRLRIVQLFSVGGVGVAAAAGLAQLPRIDADSLTGNCFQRLWMRDAFLSQIFLLPQWVRVSTVRCETAALRRSWVSLPVVWQPESHAAAVKLKSFCSERSLDLSTAQCRENNRRSSRWLQFHCKLQSLTGAFEKRYDAEFHQRYKLGRLTTDFPSI